jgi:hypothetical protein
MKTFPKAYLSLCKTLFSYLPNVIRFSSCKISSHEGIRLIASSCVYLDWKEIETDEKFPAALLPFSQPSEWGDLEIESHLLLSLRHGKSMGGDIVSLPNLTEIQDNHDNDDENEQRKVS